MNNNLPLGTVIKLKNVEKPLMIFEKENNNYIGIPYPFGYLTNKNILKFSSEKIEKIYFMGYFDPHSTRR